MSHQTTLRFTDELWRGLERAAADMGVSVAHYVREAARARLSREGYAPLRSGDAARDGVWLAAEKVKEQSLGEAESSAALWEQGRVARERARMLRDEARKRRRVRS
jgi:hypothetical protein